MAEKEAELRALHARLASSSMRTVEAHSALLQMQREHRRRLATKDQYAQELMRVGVMLEQQCSQQAERVTQLEAELAHTK